MTYRIPGQFFDSLNTAFILISSFLSFFLFIFIVDTVADVLITHPLPPCSQALLSLPSGHHHTVVCVCGLCIYSLWLIPSPSFIQASSAPDPSDSCQSSCLPFLKFIVFSLKVCMNNKSLDKI